MVFVVAFLGLCWRVLDSSRHLYGFDDDFTVLLEEYVRSLPVILVLSCLHFYLLNRGV